MAARRSPPSGDGPDAGADDSWLERALPGVRRLADREKTFEPSPPTPEPPGRAAEPVRFERVRDEGDRLEGAAPGADRSLIRRLRRDEVEPDLEVDLHGMRREAARRALHRALERAFRENLRCVRVVHGRGTRSAGEPVLRNALVGWLAEPPHGPRVLAFASSAKLAGGATYVGLRRSR